MALTDSDAPADGAGFFDEPPLPGPRAHELVSLADLAVIAQRHRPGGDWTTEATLGRIIDALRGLGNPPVGRATHVPVYVWLTDHFRPLHAERVQGDAGAGAGVVYPSERDRRLDEVKPAPWRLAEVTMSQARCLAVRAQDASAAFGLSLSAIGGSEPKADPQQVRALTCQQVRKRGSLWTDEQRNQAFRMRWKERVSEDGLAKLFDCTRQNISQQIGSKEAWKIHGAYSGKNWAPSRELLVECGLLSDEAPALNRRCA